MGCICGLTAMVAKYLLFAANVLFMLSGIAIIVVGVRIQNDFAGYSDFFDGVFSGTAITIIVIGSLICVIGFCGCCGAIRKSRCLLITYSILLIGVLIAEISVGIVALTQVDDSNQYVNEKLQRFFNDQYAGQAGSLNPTSTTFDGIQKQFGCCGVNGPTDFTALALGIPISCCGKDATSCSLITTAKTGCLTPFADWVENSVQTIGILSLCVAVCEVIAIVFACCLAQRYKE